MSKYGGLADAPSGPSGGALVLALLCSRSLAIFMATALTFAAFWPATVIPVVVTLLGFAWAMTGQVTTLPIITCCIGLASGALTGLYAHEAYVGPFLKIAHGREYKDVLASAQSAAYSDAGKILFAETSTVDTARSVGYRNRKTFCAAPVLDSGPSQTRTVSFWAVGYDCCNARGDFECGAAGNSGARGGVRLSASSILDDQYEDFTAAVQQAAAVYDLHVDDDSILIRWVENPMAEQAKTLLSAFGILILGTGLFVLLIFTAAAASALTSE